MDLTHVITFILGFLSRVLGTWFVHFFKKAVVPYIAQSTYKNVSLAGEWRAVHLEQPTDGEKLESEWTVTVTVKQLGQSISGSANATCQKGSAKGKQVHYFLFGKISNGVLDATFHEESFDACNRSAFLLQVVGDGSVLDGHRLFLGRNKNDIRSIPCQWVRGGMASKCGTA